MRDRVVHPGDPRGGRDRSTREHRGYSLEFASIGRRCRRGGPRRQARQTTVAHEHYSVGWDFTDRCRYLLPSENRAGYRHDQIRLGPTRLRDILRTDHRARPEPAALHDAGRAIPNERQRRRRVVGQSGLLLAGFHRLQDVPSDLRLLRGLRGLRLVRH